MNTEQIQGCQLFPKLDKPSDDNPSLLVVTTNIGRINGLIAQKHLSLTGAQALVPVELHQYLLGVQ